MKKKNTAIFVLILAGFLICGRLSGQEDQESGPPEIYPLKIAIVGTSRYQDTNFIVSNLKRSSQVLGISLSVSGRDFIEFKGRYSGSPDSLVEEIRGLAQDRFTVEVEKTKRSSPKNTLSITLKKIAP